jgi:flavin-dependent dehydrogenase
LGCRVVLLDGGNRRSEGVGEILSPAAAPMLRRLGLWEGFAVGPHLPVHARLSAWGGGLVEESAIMNPYGPGWLIDRRAFDQLFLKRSADLGVILRSARVSGCRACQGRGWCLDLDGDTALMAGALVDATGRGCHLSRAVGGTVQVCDRLAAVIARFEPATGQGAPPLVESTPHGWWFSAFVPSGALVAVLVVDPAEACESVARIWAAALAFAPHTQSRLAAGRPMGPLATYTANVQRGISAGGPVTCINVGDAALGVDPLSGGGLRLGLETAVEAASAVAAMLDGDREPAATYGSLLSQRFALHVAERVYYYNLEDRWPDLPFWAARRTCR